MKPVSARVGTRMASAARTRLQARRYQDLEPEPVVQANAAVQPDDHQHQALPSGAVRPQEVEQIGVVVVDAEAQMDAEGAEDVDGEPERDQEAERDLGRSPRAAS